MISTQTTMEQMIQSGALGLQETARQFDIPFSEENHLIDSADAFLTEVGRQIALGDMNYLRDQARHYDAVADYFSNQASHFSAKDFATTGNKAYENGYKTATQFANDYRSMANGLRQDATAVASGTHDATSAMAKGLRDAGKYAEHIGTAITIGQILDTALSANDVDKGIVDTLRETAKGVGGIAGGVWGAAAGAVIAAAAIAAGAPIIAGAAIVAAAAGLGAWALGEGAGYLFDGFLSFSDWVNTNYLNARSWLLPVDPLALDLDGDGIETVGINGNATIVFDHDADGIKTGTGWVKSDDGFLVLDRNGNGVIDSGRELFGVDTIKSNRQKASNGLDALADLDSNKDGVFDANDAQFANVRVWRDLNQDGVSQAGELTRLDEQGIVSINLAGTSTSSNLGNGNALNGTTSFTRTDGSTGTAANLNLAENPFYREFTDQIVLSDTVARLPDMQGAGAVRDLREAAQGSSELVSQLQSLADINDRRMSNGLVSASNDEMFYSSLKWA